MSDFKHISTQGWVGVELDGMPNAIDAMKLNMLYQHNKHTGEALGVEDVFWRVLPDQTGANGERGTIIAGIYA